jgi:uncharacterized membrane-anchored protein YjiN (DUF445 family)
MNTDSPQSQSGPAPGEIFVPTVDETRLLEYLREELDHIRRELPLPALSQRASLSLDERAANDQARFRQIERLLERLLEKTTITTRAHSIIHRANPKQQQFAQLAVELLTNLFEAYRDLSYDMLDGNRIRDHFLDSLVVEQQEISSRLGKLIEKLEQAIDQKPRP